MYYVQGKDIFKLQPAIRSLDAHSFWNWIYFVLLIVIGAFFMINLCLVVIATQFAETKRRETERMLQERKRMRSCGSLSKPSITLLIHCHCTCSQQRSRSGDFIEGRRRRQRVRGSCSADRPVLPKNKTLFEQEVRQVPRTRAAKQEGDGEHSHGAAWSSE